MSTTIIAWSLLPFLAFITLFTLEKLRPGKAYEQTLTPTDWFLNLSGFCVQGLVIPVLGYWLSTHLFPSILPQLHGAWHIGVAGAFLLNFIGVDFLYYLQHRAFHQVPWLWKLHAAHHHSPTVNIWITSRNSLVTHFLFVYMLVNPILGYLCDAPEGFFAGAMLTAALDIFRHANIKIKASFLDRILMMPTDHHRHHDPQNSHSNYGANFILWDMLFGTTANTPSPSRPARNDSPSFLTQLLAPWKTEA